MYPDHGELRFYHTGGAIWVKSFFFSGAGLSADSGLGVFRTADGIWEQYDAKKVCNYANWLENYHLVHEFYNMRCVQYEKAEPNPMHLVIGRLQQKYGAKKVKVVTQNIDNLLGQAGCTDVLHVHGRIQYVHCFSCKHEIWEIEKTGCLQKGFYAILKNHHT